MDSVKNISDNLAIKIDDFVNCVDSFEHDYTIDSIKTTIRLNSLKFDGNNVPMVTALADVLYTYIIDYCLSSKNTEEAITNSQYALLVREARSLFRRPDISTGVDDKSGEAGEILLFFLLEAVLGAPQIVSKMELKTNHKDEVKGSDGIHARWNSDLNLVDFYFGEAKLYQNVKQALKSALASVSGFHDIGMAQHEFCMVTKHFKYADEKIKEEIKSLFVNNNPGPNVRVNHAILIGFDYDGYKNHVDQVMLDDNARFKDRYLSDIEKVIHHLREELVKFDKKSLVFEIFFLPFPSVKDFRNAFNKALG